MVDKLHSYQGWTGRLHEWRESIRLKYCNWREGSEGTNLRDTTGVGLDGGKQDYSHIYRSISFGLKAQRKAVKLESNHTNKHYKGDPNFTHSMMFALL